LKRVGAEGLILYMNRICRQQVALSAEKGREEVKEANLGEEEDKLGVDVGGESEDGV
jgi:hypothetical protein